MRWTAQAAACLIATALIGCGGGANGRNAGTGGTGRETGAMSDTGGMSGMSADTGRTGMTTDTASRPSPKMGRDTGTSSDSTKANRSK